MPCAAPANFESGITSENTTKVTARMFAGAARGSDTPRISNGTKRAIQLQRTGGATSATSHLREKTTCRDM
jgi:hypothetical protein